MNPPLPRREFLRRSGATVGTAVLGTLPLAIAPNVSAAPAPSTAPAAATSLGFSLYGMKTLPVATALKTCAEIGYENVEFALMPGWPTEPKLLSAADRKQIASTLGELGLKLSALMENISPLGTDADHQRNLERLAAAAILGRKLSPQRSPSSRPSSAATRSNGTPYASRWPSASGLGAKSPPRTKRSSL